MRKYNGWPSVCRPRNTPDNGTIHTTLPHHPTHAHTYPQTHTNTHTPPTYIIHPGNDCTWNRKWKSLVSFCEARTKIWSRPVEGVLVYSPLCRGRLPVQGSRPPPLPRPCSLPYERSTLHIIMNRTTSVSMFTNTTVAQGFPWRHNYSVVLCVLWLAGVSVYVISV